MDIALKKLVSMLPFLFGLGFIAPLSIQVLNTSGWNIGGDSARILLGLLFGGGWGLIANLRGRWL